MNNFRKNHLKISLGVNTSMTSTGFLSVSLDGNPDIFDDAAILDSIKNESCEIIIASHVLEHLRYTGRASNRVKKTIRILNLWNKKLIKGGKLYISVPDWEKLFAVMYKYRENYWNIEDTCFIDPIGPIFGGMQNIYNTHSMLYNFSCLKHCLESSHFQNIKLIDDLSCFTEFNSSSKHWCSINIYAEK